MLRLIEPACPAIYPPPPECYLVGVPREAVVYIDDNTLSRPLVSIVARDPVATEGTNCYRWPGWPTPTLTNNLGRTNTATFAVMRERRTNESLTVFYTVGGTATNGGDYQLLSGNVVIPARQRVAPIDIVPVGDALPERIETVVLGLIEPPYGSPLPSPYVVGKQARAPAIIVDNDQPRPCTEHLADRCFHLTQPGRNGDWCRIEFSTNLLDWTVICTNGVTDGAIHFVDQMQMQPRSDSIVHSRGESRDGLQQTNSASAQWDLINHSNPQPSSSPPSLFSPGANCLRPGMCRRHRQGRCPVGPTLRFVRHPRGERIAVGTERLRRCCVHRLTSQKLPRDCAGVPSAAASISTC